MHQLNLDGVAPDTSCSTVVVTQSCPAQMRRRDVWRVDQFHLIRKIGSGYASTVYLATCRTTGNQVAIKLYHKNKLSELNHFQVNREIRIHSNLEHRNIIQLWAAFEDQYGIYLVSEYASKGDVFTEVERRGGQMTEMDTVRQVIHPFLSALQYLHSNSIIHRDIKPENLLFTATGVLKVGDFGLSIDLEQERPVTRVGTLDYMAPEVVVCPDKHRPSDHKEMSNLYYTCVVDSWAVGVLAYELIVGRPPFDKGQKKLTITEILKGTPFFPPWMSEGAVNFIRWSLTKEQTQRPSVVQLMEHPWVMLHTQTSITALKPKGLGRADSYVEPRMMGMGLERHNSSTPEDYVHNLQIQNVQQQNGRMIGHSNSMNAITSMRFRDIGFDANQEASSPVKRSSDSQVAAPPGTGRQSGMTGSQGPSPTPTTSQIPYTIPRIATGLACTASNTSFDYSTTAPPTMSARDLQAQLGRPLTREEVFASLQAPLVNPYQVQPLGRSLSGKQSSPSASSVASFLSSGSSGGNGSLGMGSGIQGGGVVKHHSLPQKSRSALLDPVRRASPLQPRGAAAAASRQSIDNSSTQREAAPWDQATSRTASSLSTCSMPSTHSECLKVKTVPNSVEILVRGPSFGSTGTPLSATRLNSQFSTPTGSPSYQQGPGPTCDEYWTSKSIPLPVHARLTNIATSSNGSHPTSQRSSFSVNTPTTIDEGVEPGETSMEMDISMEGPVDMECCEIDASLMDGRASLFKQAKEGLFGSFKKVFG